ncbi:MAG: pilus assembly protein PilC [Acinetobacter sp.]|jgi:type IV pilus assembly protein PilY1|uniref:PilC/PilY family type IV pilus protein n=1 Tax=Acinetobacter sp. TaxID=472 RepID=UPI002845B533|nr:PilC/PilY family type IV pilus protein [Acinetobacter sp.]MDR3028769.1 pilus assembly protein PilC [Acinetobacter sp.]
MKNFDRKKLFSTTVSMMMTWTICQSVSVNASDIDIYSNATGGKTTITMMLDTSGSMSVEQVRQSACDLPDGAVYNSWFSEMSNTTPSYPRRYCTIQGNPTARYYDRLTRLKDALFTLMDSNQIDSNNVAIGIGQFSSQSESNNVYTAADGFSGKIVVPAAPLTPAQRLAIKTAVANFQGWNGTPTASAYAEVAAYMLGETTATGSLNYPGYFITNSTDGRYLICGAWTETNCANWYGWYFSPGWVPNGYTPGATVNLFGYSGRLFLAEKGDRGFHKSVTSSKSGGRYISPLSTNNTQCDGRGIYFFTDGEPNSSYDPVSVMQRALGSAGASFSVPATGTLPDGTQAGHAMPAVGEFAKALRNQKASPSAPDRNPLGLEIKTAVVGFGSVFDVNRAADAAKPENQRIIRSLDYINSKGERTNQQRDYYNCALIQNVDARNACNWGEKSHPDLPGVGGYGEGGFYSAQSTADVIESVMKFLDEVKPDFDPVATGSPSLPKDALNPLRIQPFGYYAAFIPKPQESTQLWLGNINKYHIYNGELYNFDKTKKLILANGSLNKDADGLWTNGMKGQLPLGLGTTAANQPIVNRTIFTNRKISAVAPYSASDSNTLKKVNVETLFGTGTTGLFANDPDKNYWLNLLGYNISASATGVTLANLPTQPELRQVGAIMHSKPVLLTQKGKVTYTSGSIDTTNRDDYLLFGSTQGLLHVVDAQTGIEKFAFAPNEMMQNQKAAFLSETSSTGGKNNLFYGVDAPWTAHTQYVAKTDGTLTVNKSDRTSDGSSNQNLALKGLQWVYGGLRMGGKSYYALDLSDLEQPSLKFHIDPENAKIYKSGSSTPVSVAALSYMGQSWSKPTLAYVKFGGGKKLVMFVGGGYDTGYENESYLQHNTIGGGAGVYMFDANTGDLLWWTSANATEAKGAEAYTNTSTNSINMKYSVVSQINAIDRDSDGLVDHLYFGDLRGQTFRVDLNNLATTKADFATRVVRLFYHSDLVNPVPRFYEMPSFSVHDDGNNRLIGAVAFSSGNRSSPLSGNKVAIFDGIYVVYDKDVTNSNLYQSNYSLTTENVGLASLNGNMATGIAIANNSGWKYTFSNISGAYKGMNELYAIDDMLYVNVFHRDGAGIGGSCGAGVKGDSYIYQFCLPTGKCPFPTTNVNTPNRIKIGAGILGGGIGQAVDNNATNIGLVVPRVPTHGCAATSNAPECQKFNVIPKSQQLRWYEMR